MVITNFINKTRGIGGSLSIKLLYKEASHGFISKITVVFAAE